MAERSRGEEVEGPGERTEVMIPVHQVTWGKKPDEEETDGLRQQEEMRRQANTSLVGVKSWCGRNQDMGDLAGLRVVIIQ